MPKDSRVSQARGLLLRRCRAVIEAERHLQVGHWHFPEEYEVAAADSLPDVAEPCGVVIRDAYRRELRARTLDQEDASRERRVETTRTTDWEWEARHAGWRAQLPSEEGRGELVGVPHDQQPIVSV